MKFEVNEDQMNKFRDWAKNHPNSRDALGTHYTWSFTNNSIGCSVHVQDLLSNEILDLSEYDKW